MPLPVFVTPRLTLRSITAHDAEGLQRLMTEAASPVVSHCFTRLNVHRIEARIEPANLSSRRLAATLGFSEEGTLRDWVCVAGEFRSVVMYSLLRTEWRSRSC
jgi:ribosomal-protein-alanine N-acetyltransferase